MRNRALGVFGHWLVLAGAVVVAGMAGVAALLVVTWLRTPSVSLPFGNTNPVIYDNDWTNDYVDWYLMALATAGDISYRGISTSSSLPPYNRYMTEEELDRQVRIRTEIVEMGRRAGMRNVPDPVPGTRGHLLKPASGRLEDTQPIDSAGTRAILEEARLATPENPLVVLLGGPPTVVADAYLLDRSIADNVVVVMVDNFHGFSHGYNSWADGWAATIVLQVFRVVVFPVFPNRQFPRLSKDWIRENLPPSEARNFILESELDVVNDDDGDADGMGAVALMVPGYVRAASRASFSGWRMRDGHELPMLAEDPEGRVLIVTSADEALAAREYQRAFSNPMVWRQP